MPCQYRSKVWVNGWCDVAHRYCAATQESTCKYNKPTNADRIRAMSDEELARELAAVAGWDRTQYEKAKHIGIEKVMLDWLRQSL